MRRWLRLALGTLSLNCAGVYAAELQSSAFCDQVLSAVRTHDVSGLSALLTSVSRANANTKCAGGVTPLYIAVQLDQADVAKSLLEKGANPNTADRTGHTPLHVVGIDRNTTAGVSAAMTIASMLIDHGANVNANGSGNGIGTPLDAAAQNEQLEFAALLLNHNANARDATAARYDSLGHKISGFTALHIAAQGGVPTTLDADEQSRAKQRILFMALLLQHGAEINARAGDGETPLSVATGVEGAQFLAMKGAHR